MLALISEVEGRELSQPNVPGFHPPEGREACPGEGRT